MKRQSLGLNTTEPAKKLCELCGLCGKKKAPPQRAQRNTLKKHATKRTKRTEPYTAPFFCAHHARVSSRYHDVAHKHHHTYI